MDISNSSKTNPAIWICKKQSGATPGSVPHTTRLSSMCFVLSHTFGMHHMAKAAYLWSWTAFFFSHTQTFFSSFPLLFVERHYNPHTTAFLTARILSACKRQLLC